MKQSGKAGNFFWFIGVVTTLNCLKKMFDFYVESLDEPRKKNRSVLFLYNNQSQNTKLNLAPSQQPSARAKFKPGKSREVTE